MSEEPEPLTWDTVRLAAEAYWPQLGARVVDQIREWNAALFDNAIRPAPIVLGRPTSLCGHWFPTLAAACDPRLGFEGNLVTTHGYQAPRPVMAVQRGELLRAMCDRIETQNSRPPLKRNSEAWCRLVMETHRRLTGRRIWCAAEREIIEPREDLGGGEFRPETRRRGQDPDPETGEPSLSRATIAGWPGTVIDLGSIQKD
jgi:hypothetical protein